MTKSEDILRLMIGAHALTRIAAMDAGSETPAAQWRTLTLLRDHGPQRIGDLARLSRVSQPGMTRLAGQMVDAGLLTRAHDPDDSRASVLSVTDAGLAELEEWLRQLGSSLLPRFADVTDDDWAALHRVAQILAEKTGANEEVR